MGREKHLPGGELGVWGSLCGLGGGLSAPVQWAGGVAGRRELLC